LFRLYAENGKLGNPYMISTYASTSFYQHHLPGLSKFTCPQSAEFADKMPSSTHEEGSFRHHSQRQSLLRIIGPDGAIPVILGALDNLSNAQRRSDLRNFIEPGQRPLIGLIMPVI
jgi:hypothetical protein